MESLSDCITWERFVPRIRRIEDVVKLQRHQIINLERLADSLELKGHRIVGHPLLDLQHRQILDVLALEKQQLADLLGSYVSVDSPVQVRMDEHKDA